MVAGGGSRRDQSSLPLVSALPSSLPNIDRQTPIHASETSTGALQRKCAAILRRISRSAKSNPLRLDPEELVLRGLELLGG
jgi:hypothetical protein